MSAQRPGDVVSQSSLNGKRSFTFIGTSNGFDYLVQLPSEGHELMLGGGLGHAGNEGLAEVGISKDDNVDPEVAAYLGGALPVHFGVDNWGDEGHPDESDGATWPRGRTKAVWSGTIGWSADGLPWVGKVPEKIANRAAPRNNRFTGEWITAGFTGEGMTAAWKCGQALGQMLLANNPNLDIEWFPEPLRISERRWRKAKLEDEFDGDWGH